MTFFEIITFAIEKNASQYVVCQKVVMLPRPQCVNLLYKLIRRLMNNRPKWNGETRMDRKPVVRCIENVPFRLQNAIWAHNQFLINWYNSLQMTSHLWRNIICKSRCYFIAWKQNPRVEMTSWRTELFSRNIYIKTRFGNWNMSIDDWCVFPIFLKEI